MSDTVKPWGVIATFVLGAIALLAGQFSGIAVLSTLYGLNLGDIATVSQDGGAIVLFILVSAPVQLVVLIIAATYKGEAAAYLGYKLPRRSEVVVGVAAVAALIVVGDMANWLVGRNIVDRFQTDIYQAATNANILPLLLLAITIFIPVTEESLFRGFLFRGWLREPHHAWPVIVFTAGLFAIIHVQYDWFLIAQVFAFGVLFGWMRWATGSTILTMLLHGLVNLEGMIETILTLNN
ncbi:MAG TPA: CPBP family intramembrane glutamic endopeptidase [Pseudolabrys sp.]|nr:CPBP family intramembrane glutamic endopeptidase [Pseudolabrys sp.]